MLLLVAAATVDGLSLGVSPEPKQRLQGIFNGRPDAVLACPVDGTPLRSDVQVIGSERRAWMVSDAGLKYPVNAEYADLLETSGRSSGLTLEELAAELRDAWESRTQTQLFRSPFTAFLYERGWRQNFQNAGFPGIETEYEEVDAFFGPDAGVVVDMSCGSGLMSRRLLKGGHFERLFAMDYSEAMLKETRRRAVEEKLPLDQLELCRVDVAKLPMLSDSVDAMHAGRNSPILLSQFTHSFFTVLFRCALSCENTLSDANSEGAALLLAGSAARLTLFCWWLHLPRPTRPPLAHASVVLHDV